MTSVGLVWSNLGRRKLRTALTALSILVAFLLYGYLSAIKVALDGGNFGDGGKDRLVVRNRISITQPIPGTYERRIAMIPGVTAVARASWFGGIYQDPKNFFGQLRLCLKIICGSTRSICYQRTRKRLGFQLRMAPSPADHWPKSMAGKWVITFH